MEHSSSLESRDNSEQYAQLKKLAELAQQADNPDRLNTARKLTASAEATSFVSDPKYFYALCIRAQVEVDHRYYAIAEDLYMRALAHNFQHPFTNQADQAVVRLVCYLDLADTQFKNEDYKIARNNLKAAWQELSQQPMPNSVKPYIPVLQFKTWLLDSLLSTKPVKSENDAYLLGLSAFDNLDNTQKILATATLAQHCITLIKLEQFDQALLILKPLVTFIQQEVSSYSFSDLTKSELSEHPLVMLHAKVHFLQADCQLKSCQFNLAADTCYNFVENCNRAKINTSIFNEPLAIRAIQAQLGKGQIDPVVNYLQKSIAETKASGTITQRMFGTYLSIANIYFQESRYVEYCQQINKFVKEYAAFAHQDPWIRELVNTDTSKIAEKINSISNTISKQDSISFMGSLVFYSELLSHLQRSLLLEQRFDEASHIKDRNTEIQSCNIVKQALAAFQNQQMLDYEPQEIIDSINANRLSQASRGTTEKYIAAAELAVTKNLDNSFDFVDKAGRQVLHEARLYPDLSTAENLIAIATYYVELGDSSSAIEPLLKANEILANTNRKYHEHSLTSNWLLAECFEAINDQESSDKYKKRAARIASERIKFGWDFKEEPDK